MYYLLQGIENFFLIPKG